jgi:hypothetical protein
MCRASCRLPVESPNLRRGRCAACLLPPVVRIEPDLGADHVLLHGRALLLRDQGSDEANAMAACLAVGCPRAGSARL